MFFAFRTKVYGAFFLRMNYHISLMVRLVYGDLGVVYHKVILAFFLRMNYHISFMVRLVNGDLGVVYHKVIFCEMKCIQKYE